MTKFLKENVGFHPACSLLLIIYRTLRNESDASVSIIVVVGSLYK